MILKPRLSRRSSTGNIQFDKLPLTPDINAFRNHPRSETNVLKPRSLNKPTVNIPKGLFKTRILSPELAEIAADYDQNENTINQQQTTSNIINCVTSCHIRMQHYFGILNGMQSR